MPISVSVIIPTYNDGDVIERAIRSVLNQSHSHFELIIVDDGSEDDTKEVVRSFSDNRITFINHDSNQGGAAARNTGIEASSGEYIAFLDADDEWKPDKLKKQVSLMESRTDEFVASYCAADVNISPLWDLARGIYNDIFSTHEIIGKEGGKELIDEMIKLNFSIGGSSTLMVERETATMIEGFDEAFQRHQDLEFLIRILEQGKLSFLDEELVIKYDAGRPPSSIVKKERMRFLNKFSDRVFELEMEGHNVIDQHLLNLSIVLFFNGDIRQGMSNIFNYSAIDRKNTPRLIWSLTYGVLKKVFF